MAKIEYITVRKASEIWNLSERSVRNYCTQGRVQGAIQKKGAWIIPSSAEKPSRKPRHVKKEDTLLDFLKREKDACLKGGIYHRLQIDLTYNSNHIEGSRLTQEQTRFIFETQTVGITEANVKVDDIVETVNHFRCIDLVIEGAEAKLSESFIKQLHFVLKSGTTDSRRSWFKVGDYKMLENEVGGNETAKPSEVASEMKSLLYEYNSKKVITLDDILDFHVRFEAIHPFQDGNGRIGRLLMFKECLKHNIVPFIITEDLKMFYYRGIREWKRERGFLRDTCLAGQDSMKPILDYFSIKYQEQNED